MGEGQEKYFNLIVGENQIHHMTDHSLIAIYLVVTKIIRNNSLRIMITNVRAIWPVAIVISRAEPNSLTDGWNNIAIFWILNTL